MKHQALFHGDLVNTTRIIYTPSEFAKTSLLHVQEIGTLQAQKPHVSKREDLDSYLFFMVRSGSGELHYAHNTYPLGVGDCVFIDCRSAYFHETKDDLWSLSWVGEVTVWGKTKEVGSLLPVEEKGFIESPLTHSLVCIRDAL